MKSWTLALALLGCGSTETSSGAPDGGTDAAGDPDANDAGPEPRPVDGGQVPGPIAGGTAPTAPVGLGEHGYVEEEFFLEGDATAYRAEGELGLGGVWNTEPDGQAPYTTRLLVRRPVDASDFDGTVFVEWLNVTGGIDAAVGYAFAWEELLRGGYAYVGVSVQKVGVDALKSGDPDRYGSLNHPGDAHCYDLFTQAGAAIGWPGEVDVLAGLPVERLLAYGESQSAMRMITYVNAVHPLANVFDGFIIHSRAGWGAPVGTESDGFLGDGTPVRVREDIDEPVLQFFTESEIFLAPGPAFHARQPDSEHVRTWEVAGTAHADQHLLGEGADLGCGGLVNGGPQHFVVKAAVRAMHTWLSNGEPPPTGDALEVNAAETAIARDARGNALGGIRTPAVDVPIATHSGEPAPDSASNPLCMPYGLTIPFTPEELLALYPTHQDYVDQVTESARATREAGFVLPEEEATLVAEAEAAGIPE
jgi:hypothetical protein